MNHLESLSLARLGLMFLPVALVLWLSQRWNRNAGEGLHATARMLGQLLAIGYLLDFLFNARADVVIPVVLTVMITVSSWIALRTVKHRRRALFLYAFAALMLGGGLCLGLALAVVGVPLLGDSRTVIPLAGMTFSNGMTALSLGAERFEEEIQRGATPAAARSRAFNTALIPTVNALFAVGLVSLPGMMTGQILSGVDPLIAVRYQILVMALLYGTCGLSTAIYLAAIGHKYASATRLPAE